MKKSALLLALAASLCFAAEEHSTFERTFPVVPADARLIVDTVEGNITVTGYSGSEIRATVEQTWRGDTAQDLERARNEIRLDVRQEGDTVRLYVDGPFRNRNGSGDYGRRYGARFDFEVQVPVEAGVELRAVNGSRITVGGIDGAYSVHNVNGSIEMTGIGGAGEAGTVNGRVSVSFRRNPTEASTFKTVNGDVAAEFQPGLSAEITVKIVNGEAWTNFPATALASTEAGEREGTRFIFRRNRSARLRAGSGGPELSFETVNGSIEITGEGR